MNLYGSDLRTGYSAPRQRVFFLGLGAALMVFAAWALAPAAGAPIAVMATLYGWMACWILMRPRIATAPVPPVEVAAAPAGPDANAMLRHDLRGILSPALMVADRLLAHEDASVRRAGDVMVRTVQRATERLEQSREKKEVLF